MTVTPSGYRELPWTQMHLSRIRLKVVLSCVMRVGSQPVVNLIFAFTYAHTWRGLPGVFMDNAQELIKHPILTDDDLYRRFKTTVDHSLQHGLTSLHDAGFKPDSLAFFRRYMASSPPRVRTALLIQVYPYFFFGLFSHFQILNYKTNRVGTLACKFSSSFWSR